MDIDLKGLVLPERVERVESEEDGAVGKFVIEPLERGFGHTLGNSVRRVLLSALRGAGVWAFRIDGVVHEHQTVEGVVEDVHQIIQNLKSLVLVLDEDIEEATLEVRADSPGRVTAGAIDPPGSVRILDPDHHLFTLEDDREITLELYVNKGRGFVLSEDHSLPRGAPVDLVQIDSIYNPVRRANFSVEETRVGQRTDFDRLILTVETDGSVDAEDALGYAAQLVGEHMKYMLYFGEDGIPQEAPAGAVELPDRFQDLLRRPIEDLAELSVRSRNSLQKENIELVSDLVQRTEEQMLLIENFGKKSLKEIAEFLDEQGLRFDMKLQESEDGILYLMEEVEEEEAEREGAEAGE